jgi:dienelactone hydrolase
MAEVLLFHHAQGLTAGCLSFADDLRAAGHVVHVPDLYEGRTFTRLAAADLPRELVYAGMSLGVMPAQRLAQTRPGGRGALLLHSAVPIAEFGGAWPEGVPLQIHTMEDDDWGDVDIARDLVATVPSAELFLYPGDRHLFSDSSLPAYDQSAAALLKKRVLAFLDAIG